MADPNLEQRLESARRAAPTWSLLRQQQVIWQVRGRQLRARRVGRVASFAVAAALALAAGGYALYARPSERLQSNGAQRAERWNLRDGSTIFIETAATVITKQRESIHEVSFDLDAGSARFEVARRPERAFRVQAGVVRVEVVGTSFRLERRGPSSWIGVDHGRVRVSWPAGSQELSAGQSGVFPPELPVSTAAAPSSPASSAGGTPLAIGNTSLVAGKLVSRAAGTVVGSVAASVSPTPSSREARPSDARKAEANVAKPLSAEGLFSAADAARAAGNYREAQTLLLQITQSFPADPRAPLAAFTRGRLLLESLHEPAAAARAFAEARALAGVRGTLHEDALAREVDAWRAAGNAKAAHERAETYRKLYPKGLRLPHVLRSGSGLSSGSGAASNQP